LEEREPNASKGQYGEAGTDGQPRQYRRAGFGWVRAYCRFYDHTVLFLVTMTPSLTASEKLPLVGRSPSAAQGSITLCRFHLATKAVTQIPFALLRTMGKKKGAEAP